MTSAVVDTLTQINLNDLVSAFGWQNQPRLARPLRRLFVKPGQIFAHQMSDFDSALGAHGLVEASRLTIKHYVRDLRVFNTDRVPASGFLALSNHPRWADRFLMRCRTSQNNSFICGTNLLHGSHS